MLENPLCSKLLHTYGKYMNLKLYVDSSDNELKEKYAQYIKNRETKMMSDIDNIDAGFDIFTAKDETILSSLNVHKLDFNIVCSAEIVKPKRVYRTGYYMYPRSSISKTTIRLANNVGIIDAGYRGHLIGAFDCTANNTVVNKFDRYLQICAPGLIPIIVTLVNSMEELGNPTARGAGGFGSTGV
jgi:dUTP pyrophosphatase